MQPLPYGRQWIDEDDVAAVVGVLRSDWLAHGPKAAAFEQAFADKVGAREAVACSSGTAALHLALKSLDVGEGDLCVVPAITFLSTATAALMCGAEVRFADVHPETGLMTPETLAEAIGGDRVRAVLPVHLGGRIADIAELALLARGAGAVVVEDACHAIGGTDDHGGRVGDCRASDAACFSFHPVKTLAAGEGGMVALNDPDRATRMRRLRNHGVTHDPALMTEPCSFDATGARNPWSYEQLELGFNYRMDEMSAALGLSQLSRLDRFARRRAELAALYDEGLAAFAPGVRPAPTTGGQPALHLYQVLVDFEAAKTTRASLMTRMAAKGVQTQVHYIPLYRQPVLGRHHDGGPLAGAEAFYERVLALPLFPAMTDADVGCVIETLASALRA